MRVILVARRQERLNSLQAEIMSAGGKAEVVVADLRSGEERVHVFEQAGSLFFVDWVDTPYQTDRRQWGVIRQVFIHVTEGGN